MKRAVSMEALPLTAIGKVDRGRLPAPDARAFGVKVYEAPRGGVEEALAELWATLLRVAWLAILLGLLLQRRPAALEI